MTLTAPRCVHVEKSGVPFAEIMNNLRAWLDHHKIEPAEFKSQAAAPDLLALDIRFEREEEAQLFERNFA